MLTGGMMVHDGIPSCAALPTYKSEEFQTGYHPDSSSVTALAHNAYDTGSIPSLDTFFTLLVSRFI